MPTLRSKAVATRGRDVVQVDSLAILLCQFRLLSWRSAAAFCLIALCAGVADAGAVRQIQGRLALQSVAAGCVSDAGSVTFTASATLEVDIGGPAPCSEHDRLAVTGALSLQGATLRVNLVGGYQPAAGMRFDVLDWGSLTGTFGALLLPPLAPGFAWDTTRLYTDGSLGITGPEASDGDVPLPPWALALLGALVGARLLNHKSRRTP